MLGDTEGPVYEAMQADLSFVRLEAEVAAPLPQATFQPAKEVRTDSAQVQFLQQMVNKLQKEDDLAEKLHGPVERPRVRQRVSPSHIPEVVPLSNWILDRHSDLQEAMSAGDIQQVLELTSLQSQAPRNLPN